MSGISGDMTIGALLDLGIDQQVFLNKLKGINITGYQIGITKKLVNGISGTDFDVILEHHHHHEHNGHSHHHPHRNLDDINKIIEDCQIDNKTKQIARDIFSKIAVAEAKVHGKTVDKIHFHEVGAIDSIIDILGTAICISILKPDKIYSSPLHLGSGTVKCAHGVIPVPAPATVEILKDVPIYSTGVKGELVTPTGAAIIKSLVDEFIQLPAMTLEKTGYGTGKKQYDIPNLLRVFLGTDNSNETNLSNKLIALETNIDDMNPETYSYLIPLLLEKGALDAYLTNVIMKKGRPGVMLNVLCQPENIEMMENILFTQTTTLGIRKTTVNRHCLERRPVMIKTELGEIQAKAAYKDGKLLKIAPEYEECRKLAEEKQIPIKDIYNMVITGSVKPTVK